MHSRTRPQLTTAESLVPPFAASGFIDTIKRSEATCGELVTARCLFILQNQLMMPWTLSAGS